MTQSQGISEQDRGDARRVLDEQWRSGVIDPGEHERRVTLLRHASTRADLDRALQGLQPGMGMTGPVLPPLEARAEQGADSAGGVAATRSSDRTRGLVRLDRNTAGTIVALTPFACIFAVFVLHAPWWIFLLWFVVPIVIYGKDGRDEHRAEQHERRARRHAAKAARHRRRMEGQ